MRAFKFRLYPTKGQHGRLNGMLAAHCDLYNAALQERRDAYRHPSKTRVRATDQMKQLTAIRREVPEQAVWSFTSQQQTLRRLDKAFQAFFRRVKNGETPGYPRFRSKARFDSVDFRHGDGCRLLTARPDGTPYLRSKGRRHEARLYLQGVGHVRVLLHRPLPDGAQFGQVSVKREGRGRSTRWHVVVPVEAPEEQPAPTGAVVGLDMATGANGLAWTSDGHNLPNPRHLHHAAAKLAAAQRKLAGQKRGSTRRQRQVEKVAALHGRVRRARLDHLHKTARQLVTEHDVIVVEALKTANMTRRPKPVPDPDRPGTYLPNRAAAKAGLNKSILDTGWGVFLTLLHAKAESAGRVIIEVNPRNTSRTCHECGHVAPENREARRFCCVACGFEGHADVNAARNILRAGLAQHHAPAA